MTPEQVAKILVGQTIESVQFDAPEDRALFLHLSGGKVLRIAYRVINDGDGYWDDCWDCEELQPTSALLETIARDGLTVRGPAKNRKARRT